MSDDENVEAMRNRDRAARREAQSLEGWTLENLRAHLRSGAKHTGWSIHAVAEEADRRLGDLRERLEEVEGKTIRQDQCDDDAYLALDDYRAENLLWLLKQVRGTPFDTGDWCGVLLRILSEAGYDGGRDDIREYAIHPADAEVVDAGELRAVRRQRDRLRETVREAVAAMGKFRRLVKRQNDIRVQSKSVPGDVAVGCAFEAIDEAIEAGRAALDDHGSEGEEVRPTWEEFENYAPTPEPEGTITAGVEPVNAPDADADETEVVEVCAGCGEEWPCSADCPAGTYKVERPVHADVDAVGDLPLDPEAVRREIVYSVSKHADEEVAKNLAAYVLANCRLTHPTDPPDEGEQDLVAELLDVFNDIAEAVWKEEKPWDVSDRGRRIIDAIERGEHIVMKRLDCRLGTCNRQHGHCPRCNDQPVEDGVGDKGNRYGELSADSLEEYRAVLDRMEDVRSLAPYNDGSYLRSRADEYENEGYEATAHLLRHAAFIADERAHLRRLIWEAPGEGGVGENINPPPGDVNVILYGTGRETAREARKRLYGQMGDTLPAELLSELAVFVTFRDRPAPDGREEGEG